MKMFIYILRKTSTFKIFGILMLSNLTLYSIIQNSANYTFGYNHRRMDNQNNSLASLIRQNSKMD